MKWLKKIGRVLSTLILGDLLIITIVMAVYVADTRATVMSADWVKGEMVEEGFYTAIKQELSDKLKDGLAGDFDQEQAQKIKDTVDTAVTTEWAQANFENNVDVAYAYLKSQSDNLNLSITLPPTLKQGIKDAIAEVFQESTDLTPEQLSAGLAAVNQQVDNLPNEIAIQVQNAEALQPVRDVVKIYDYIYYILIAFAILLASLLILLHFTVKDAIRVVGIYLLIGGAICWGIAFTLNKIATNLIEEADLSTYITKDMILNVVKDLVGPANMYSIVFMVVAAVLVAASFIIRGQAKDKLPGNDDTGQILLSKEDSIGTV